MKQFDFIDLTHPLTSDIPSWNGSCGFKLNILKDYDDYSDNEEVKFRSQEIKMEAGMGTHMDAPCHCIPSGKSISDIPLEQLIAPCVVINVSSFAQAKTVVSKADIESFEKQYKTIPADCVAIIHTGWDKYWSNSEKYRNNLVFPSLSVEAAELLLQRDVVGIAIDTLSPDRPESGYPVHKLILGAGKYIIENVANASKLPPTGSYLIALPLNIKDATEAPMRLVGLVPK